MADPEGLKTTVLHGKYIQPDALGTPNAGTVTFTPNPAVIIFPDQNVLVMGQLTATLDANGEFVIELISTDTAHENPSGWLYSVTERIIGQKQNSYNIALPYNSGVTVELADITPTSVAPTYIPVVGPQGAPGVIQNINGYSTTNVTLHAADVGAVATTAVGAASGVAPLDASTKVAMSYLYGGVANGVATLDATTKVPVAQIPDLSGTYVTIARIGAASGVAPLDATSKLTSTYLNLSTAAPGAIATAGAVGTSTLLARQDHTHAGLTQAATDARYPQKSNLALNAVDYGFVGDGVTDNASAITALLAGVGANGAEIYFPPGFYYVNSGTGFNLATANIQIRGSGPEVTKFLIGSGFTGAQLFNVNAANVTIRDVTIQGNNSTTTSNPVANAITVQSQRRPRVENVNFWYINGWTIELISASSGSNYPSGTQIGRIYGNSCAGGIHLKGNTAQSFAMNAQVSDVQYYGGGVTTGASANLDGICIEDAWDVLISSPVVWMSVGTGSAMHIKGNSAASFLSKVDFLGPNTGSNVLIEDSANGSPQNTQMVGGVVQQGNVGMTISGGASNVHLAFLRFINNQTHGLTISGTGAPINLFNVFFSTSGQVATGTNYDINWSGTATGYVTNCRFVSPIVATGTAGVQQTVNIAANQSVKFLSCSFSGTGASSANWFTNTPQAVLESGSGWNFATPVSITAASGTALGITGGVAGQRLFGTTALATDATAIAHGAGIAGETFDRFRLLVDSTMQAGPGTSGRDLTMGYASAAGWYINKNLVVGGTAGLGDNGSGKLSLVDATTKPTSVPTGGTVLFSQTANAIPLMAALPDGTKRSVIDGWVYLSADVTSSGTGQTTTALSGAVESSATYLVEAWLYWTTANSATVTTSWTTTATGSTMIWNDTTAGGDAVLTLTGVSPSWTTGTKMVFLRGILATSTTAGNLTLTIASSVAASVTLKAGSYLTLRRIK